MSDLIAIDRNILQETVRFLIGREDAQAAALRCKLDDFLQAPPIRRDVLTSRADEAKRLVASREAEARRMAACMRIASRHAIDCALAVCQMIAATQGDAEQCLAALRAFQKMTGDDHGQ